MPPKKGPKASRLCDSIPSNTEIPDRKDPIRVLQEIGRGGFARIYKAEIKSTREPCAVKIEPSQNGCLYVEMKLFQSILNKAEMSKYMSAHKLKFLGLPQLIRFGVFECNEQHLRYIAMPLYHASLQTYIDSKPGKVIGLSDISQFLPIILNAYDYLHSNNVVHADLKAENLMFPLKQENNLKVLTLIDFGMAGRKTERALEKANKKQAHNGTPYFTSTDAHDGFTPTYRGDYEILGHNLFAWLGGLEKLPWKNHVKDLDKVNKMKKQYINDPKLVLKVVSAPKGGASLISKVYELASATDYKDEVDNSLLRLEISKLSKLGGISFQSRDSFETLYLAPPIPID